MEEPQTNTIIPEMREIKKDITIKYDGKEYSFSHVDNMFFPNFAFLIDNETKNIIQVALDKLEEDTLKKITEYLKKQMERKEKYDYDLDLYLALLHPSSGVREELILIRQGHLVTSENLVPQSLFEGMAMRIAKAKKKKEKYVKRTPRYPKLEREYFKWFQELGLNPQQTDGEISIDFSKKNLKKTEEENKLIGTERIESIQNSPEIISAENLQQEESAEKHGFRKVYHFNKNDEYMGNADFVLLVWHDNQILTAEQYRKANYPYKIVDIAVCQNPNVQKEQLKDRAVIL